MGSIIKAVLLGFFLGMRHATDSDHVIAVTTIVSRHRSVRYGAWIGMLWGVGHTLTIVAVGAAIILFGLAVPARLGLSMELCVALMLVILGGLNLAGILGQASDISSTVHRRQESQLLRSRSHDVNFHGLPHDHQPDSDDHGTRETISGMLDRMLGRHGFYQACRPLVVGIVHGLAGSAAVALLVLTTISSPLASVVYLFPL